MSTSLSIFGLFTPSSRKSRSSRRPRRKLDWTPQCEQLEIKIAPATLAVLDPGFEAPVLATGAFQYDPPTGTPPTATPWSFTGSSGISGNNSGFTSGNPNAPQGAQVAFLQGYRLVHPVRPRRDNRALRAHLPGRRSRQLRGDSRKTLRC